MTEPAHTERAGEALRLTGMRTTRRGARWAGLTRNATLALAAILLLGSCTGSGDGDNDAASGSSGGFVDDESGGGNGEDLSGASREAAPGEGRDAVRLAGEETYEIKRGMVELEASDVTGIVDRLYTLAARVDGDVAREETLADAEGKARYAALMMRVPVDTFDDVMREVSGYGLLRARDVSSDDVSARVADVDTRVDNARASLTELRAMFSRATKLGDVILLESEIADRQAALESLLAQQRTLAQQTSMSEVSVSVSRPQEGVRPPGDAEDRAGFVSGLERGWDALVALVLTVGHVIGAALPITLLLLGGFLALRPVLRRFRPDWWRPAPPAPPSQHG